MSVAKLKAEREKLLAKAAALEEQAREARARAFALKGEIAGALAAESQAPAKAPKKRK